MFKNCSELQNVSRLFSVSNVNDGVRGLRIIQSTLFDPNSTEDAANPRIVSIQGMFSNNRLLRGSIPLFDVGKFTRIRDVIDYVGGVNKNNITNANIFITMHPVSWIPQDWIENE